MTNEDGTPVYEVEITETRLVSIKMKGICIAENEESAIRQTQNAMDREWALLESTGYITISPVIV